MFIAARSRAMTWAASNRFSVNSEFITCKGKMKITNQLLIQWMAAVMVRQKSKRLKTKKSWVRILPAAGLFFFYYPLSNMSLLMYFTNIVFLIFYENWKWTEWIKFFLWIILKWSELKWNELRLHIRLPGFESQWCFHEMQPIQVGSTIVALHRP